MKSKKILLFILFILFIIIFITLGTKSFASWYPDAFYDEDEDRYYEIYIGQSIRLSYYGLDDENFGGQITLNDDTYGTNDDNDKENIFCIQKGQSLPSKGTATVKAIIDIEPGGITMRDVVTRDFSWYTDAEKRSLFRMAYILNQQGEHSRIQYDAEDGDYPPYYSEKQKAVWENIGGFLGITINRESDSTIATTSGEMTSSLTNSDECKEYQESALAYENNGRTALSKKRDTSDVKKSECTYNNENYFKIGPFKYSYAFSLDDVKLYDENGNSISDLKFGRYSGNSFNVYDSYSDGIKSGEDFYILINKNKGIKKITKFSISTTSSTYIKATLYLLETDDNVQNVLTTRTSTESHSGEDEFNLDIVLTQNLKIVKRDTDTQKALANVKFKIKRNSDNKFIKNSNGNITYVDETNATEFYTNYNGEITVSNVLVDTYTAIEIENPNKGYEKYPNASITLNGTTSNNTITTYIDNKRKYVDLSGYVWEDIRKW